MSTKLKIEAVRVDGGTQTRAQLDAVTVADYADAMTEGATFPPITVYHDGSDYWLADGFHRVAAAKQIGNVEIEADVLQGSRRDAILHSVGANADHGLRRTNADKRRAVETLLRDDEWRQWSDREIARRAQVSDRFVNKVRDELSANRSQIHEPTERKVERNGTTYTQNTEKIGKKPEQPVSDHWFEQDDEEVDDEPQRRPVEDEWPDAEAPSSWIMGYIAEILSDIREPSVKHEVVNNVLKRLREMSVEMNRGTA